MNELLFLLALCMSSLAALVAAEMFVHLILRYFDPRLCGWKDSFADAVRSYSFGEMTAAMISTDRTAW